MLKSITSCMLVICAWMLLCAGPSFAGAWTMQEGKLYERLAFNYYYADKEFDEDGSTVSFPANGKYRDMNLSNYLEYGLTDKLTVINSLFYKRIEKEEDFRKTTAYGVGDIDLGLKYKLAEGSAGVFSAQVLVKIPEAYDKNADLPLGNGQYDAEIRMLYGRSLWEFIPGYFNLEVGYRWRAEEPSDELRYLAEFGMDITKSYYGRVKLDGIRSANNGDNKDSSGNPTATNNFDLGKLDVVLGGKLTQNWGVELGYTPSIYGENTAAGTSYTVAVTYQTH